MREPRVQVKTDSEDGLLSCQAWQNSGVRPVKCLHGASVRAAEEMKVITVSVE